jgi:hypothetical protein
MILEEGYDFLTVLASFLAHGVANSGGSILQDAHTLQKSDHRAGYKSMLGKALPLWIRLGDVVAVVLTLEQGETTSVEVKVGNPPSLPGYEGLINETALFPEFVNSLRKGAELSIDMMLLTCRPAGPRHYSTVSPGRQ